MSDVSNSNRLLGIFILSAALGLFLYLLGGLQAGTLVVIACVLACVGIAWLLGREYFRLYQPNDRKGIIFLYGACALVPVLNGVLFVGDNVMDWVGIASVIALGWMALITPDHDWL